MKGSGAWGVLSSVSLIGIWNAVIICEAAVLCSDDKTCVDALNERSVCENGFCTNPFHRGGCLANMHPDWQGIRTCSSDDGQEALEKGYCRPPTTNYTEISIFSHNWESAYFSTWIVQIMLSELLNVPVAIETGDPDVVVDFYEERVELGFGKASYDWGGLEVAAAFGDCRLVNNDTSSCSHLFLEGWLEPLPTIAERLLDEQKIEPPMNLGAFGGTSTFVPKFTGQRDPSLLSYLGIQGDANRRKLADRFLRPATWNEYCTEESADNCAFPDEHATRMPSDEERDLYFLEGQYDGYFRATLENKCDINPNCTGLLVDWPCGWTSYAQAQVHHLDIALEVVPYTYEALLQIFSAANATKSDVIFKWWTPSLIYDEYFATDMELTRVSLPPSTQACSDARVDVSKRCSGSFEERVGSPDGACEEQATQLSKVFSTAFKLTTQPPDINEALWSPAYEAVENFQISQLQLSEINQFWIEKNVDKWNYDPREAACQWIVENLDLVESFIPESYPRRVKDRPARQKVGPIIAAILAFLLLLLILYSSVLIARSQGKKAIYHSQVEFLALYCFGLMFIATSSTLANFPTSDGICNITVWTENLGHTCVFILLALKIDAINRNANSGNVMQRVRLSSKQMLVAIGSATSIVATVLLVWSAFENVEASVVYELSEEVTQAGEVAILVSNICRVPRLERIVCYGIRGGILLYAIALGLVISRGRNDVNSGKSLTKITLLHGVFLSFRFLLFLVSDSIDSKAAQVSDSLLLSTECLMVLIVLVLPKLIGQNDDNHDSDEPLPDLFPKSTILLADLVGFTKWSSMREPSNVFKMLETIYGEFDLLAETFGVFKVETVGDCYVAATGIPDSGTKVVNAVSMAKFAASMLKRMIELSKELEMIYGPDTGNMSIRIGVHSGQVTGGFLRGRASRFQLFGDTINVASRMESNGLAGRIQFSEVTAKLLEKGGGGDWVEKRENLVLVKGKGAMQTYWLSAAGYRHCITSRGEQYNAIEQTIPASEDIERKRRLVEWNTSELYNLLKALLSHRLLHDAAKSDRSPNESHNFEGIPIEEFDEVLSLPAFNGSAFHAGKKRKNLALDPAVRIQLQRYVQAVADRYPANAFHNFAHASHVSLSVIKYLNRISAPSQIDADSDRQVATKMSAALLHKKTYGIATDPLVRFACVFSALIHDIDHPGIPNAQFLTENKSLASKYDGRSMAEQNSIDIAWKLLFREDFKELRTAICPTESDVKRFRQLMVNIVLSTDISDKHLKRLRNARWEKAFSSIEQVSDGQSLNLRAAAVIEHVIQAADVSHTMQHWHAYLEWNEKLFQEMYTAYINGRSPTNPADSWFEAEISFFEFYIIPLSERLRDSGIFGVSSDENLNYARQNRDEWIAKGRRVVADYVKKMESIEGDLVVKSAHSQTEVFV